MKNRLVLPVVLVMFGAVVLVAATATAADKPEQDVSALIKALSERLEAQDKKISTLESKLTDEALQNARHEEIARIMSEMRQDASKRDALPQWLDNLTFFGDLRLRYEHRSSDGIQLRERNRYQFRLRFGFIKSWLDDQMKVGFRLASGDNNTVFGRNTDQTFTGGFNKKDLWIDQVYAVYSPKAIPGLTVIGGKIPNILEHTDLMFDSDLNPEGFALAYHREVCGIDVFGNFAHIVVNEVNQQNAAGTVGHDTILNVYQAGFRSPLPGGMNATIAATWYDFENYEDAFQWAAANIAGAGGVVNGWNRDMKIMNVLAKVKFKACGLPWQVYADWAHNTQDNDETADFENADDGYAVGVKVGKNKKQGDWSAGYQYKYIEFNATPAILNDMDFTTDGPGLGATTNVKGHVFKVAYNLTDFLTAGGNVFLVQPITGDRDENNFIMQFDLIWKF
ncbi:MAG: putative porin [Phycisphaerae bacterium]|nr:putative porin [Phycisphaerae bacterium]